ncbi:ATP-grasp domain-containing protein [Mediterranea massiliensis]|uniref:ATP-grasp domain-containing protein n=1 Tax=Mediterranea massiliensis TaxID=1841865 RepID=UPI0032086ED7
MNKNSILIFGVGELQQSIIERAKLKGLYVVGIDPCPDAYCRDIVDSFEIVDGQDYEKTLAVAEKYKVSALVTAATDKPLIMMAKVANMLRLPFFSEETAINSTDKFLMKECFIKNEIPCARGRLISSVDEIKDLKFPLIVKPRDNSGSRGVKLCNNRQELQGALYEALKFTHKQSVLVEEFIEGQEYSVEAIHYEGKSHVVQYTEKRVTPFPYNVELGHLQPANLNEKQRNEIERIISVIGRSLKFENCASHTELKINSKGLYIIETSPRLGGDYITSILVPLSTGINIEDCLLDIALGKKISIEKYRGQQQSSGVRFFSLKGNRICSINPKIESVNSWNGLLHFSFKLKENDVIPAITSSLSRYGEFIVQTESREDTIALLDKYEKQILEYISID